VTPQPRLFYESFEDAAKQVIASLGGPKAVGQKLWPAKTADAARTRLLDCLNPDRADKLDASEILTLARWGRDVGCHAIIDFLSAEAGYTKPSPIAPQDEQAELQRRFIESAGEMRRILSRLDPNGNLRAVG
jgi:hypothetical protein